MGCGKTGQKKPKDDEMKEIKAIKQQNPEETESNSGIHLQSAISQANGIAGCKACRGGHVVFEDAQSLRT